MRGEIVLPGRSHRRNSPLGGTVTQKAALFQHLAATKGSLPPAVDQRNFLSHGCADNPADNRIMGASHDECVYTGISQLPKITLRDKAGDLIVICNKAVLYQRNK